MCPAQCNVLASKANSIVETGQLRVGLLWRVSDRLPKHVADVEVILFAKTVIHAAAKLVVITSPLRIAYEVVVTYSSGSGDIRLREVGNDQFSHGADMIGRNNVTGKGLTGGAKGRIAAA